MKLYKRYFFVILFTFIVLSFCKIQAQVISCTTYNHTSDFKCYPNDLSATFQMAKFQSGFSPSGYACLFGINELDGDLDVSSTTVTPDSNSTFWSSNWEGYRPYTYGSYMYIDFTYEVDKNDVLQGKTKRYEFKYKIKYAADDDFSTWIVIDTFSVDIEGLCIITNHSGVLCSSQETYSIATPAGYSTSWAFSNSTLVTPSSGSTTYASITGTCNRPEDGVLTFTLTQSGCPTHVFTRDITVNGPDPTNLSLSAYYTNGNPAPKGGSTYLLCANTHYYIYLDNDFSYACGVSNLTWTIPSGWTKNYQSSNMISIYTGSSPGGQVSVKGQTCCSGCGSNMSLITDYFGIYYSCGGYYMASPNPGSEYVDVDYAPEATELIATSSTLDLELKLVDKMGTVVCTENVFSFPHRINTSKLKEGNYVVMIRDKKADSMAYESFQILIEH